MLSDHVYAEKQLPGPLRQTWQYFCANTLALVSLYGLIALLGLCLFGELLAPYGTEQQFNNAVLLPPSWSHHGDIAFFFGTDDLGRDVLSRLLCGVAPTIGSALLVTLCSLATALVIGLFAGMTQGLRAALLNHLLDALLCLPSLLLAIIVIAFMGARLEHALLAVWLGLTPRLVRAIYNAVQAERKKEYVTAARLDGAHNLTLLWYCILPNILPSLVSEITRALSIAILDIAALGFLGMGAQFPSPEWGRMTSDSLDLIYIAPWTVLLPGIAISLSILIINLLGDGIRHAIEAGAE